MQFTGKSAFGRHETFALRYAWLTKGFQEFTKTTDLFKSDEATVALGVGKNMVHAILYWLLATKMLEKDAKIPATYHATKLGNALFAGEKAFDPYLEDEATIWLLHWNIATNPDIATSWYWFFNCFHKAEFNSDEAVNALIDFTNTHRVKASEKSMRLDINVLLRMYTQSQQNKKTPLEEQLDSPLSLLGLVSEIPNLKQYQSRPDKRDSLPALIVGYAVNELFKQTTLGVLPIEELMYAKNGKVALGSVFRLTESDLLTKLELFIHQFPENYELREDAGIHQLHRLKNIDSFALLQSYYKPS